MNQKKMLALLISSMLVISAVTGCGSNNENIETSKGEGTSQEKSSNTANEVVEITFWDNNADTRRTEIFSEIITDFEAENPNIKVKFVPIPANQTKSKYDVAIQSGTAPDCGLVLQYWMSDFMVQDALVPLDEYMAEWEGADKQVKVFQDSIRDMDSQGNTYGLAYTVTLPAVWYNTKVFEEKGVSVPTNWDELLQTVETVTDKTKGLYGFSLRGGAGNTQQFEQMMYQYSGITEMFDENGKSTVNAPEHVELLEKFAAIYNVYTPESDITNAATEMITAFDSGSAAMIFHNLGSYGQHLETLGKGNFGSLVNLESTNDTKVIVSNGCIGLSVFKDSKHPEEAFKFISYLCEKTASSKFNQKIGQVPCNTEALGEEWVNDAEPIKAGADALLDENTELATLPINIVGYYDLHRNNLTEGFQNVLLGNITAQKFLDDWAEQMTQLKAEYEQYIAK